MQEANKVHARYLRQAAHSLGLATSAVRVVPALALERLGVSHAGPVVQVTVGELPPAVIRAYVRGCMPVKCLIWYRTEKAGL